jgi:PAS domain S-box-containing protein
MATFNKYSVDIAELRLAKKALSESEECFRAIAETTPAGIGIIGLSEGDFLYANSAYLEYFGYSKGELIGRKTQDIYWDTRDRDHILEELKKNNFVADYEVKLKRKDGTPFWGMSSVRPITFDGIPALLGTFVDITERKRMEDEIKALAKFPSENPNPVLRLDEDGKIIYANEASKVLLQTWECSAGDFIPEIWFNEIKETFKTHKQRAIEIECNDQVLSFDITPVKDGSYVNMYGRNITIRKKAEEALKNSEKKLWSVLNATQESVYMFDAEGKFTLTNSTGLKRLNSISEKDLIGHHFSEFMTSKLARQRQSKLDEVFKTGKPLEFDDERNGSIYHHNFFPVFNEKEVSHVVVYSTDITERKKKEFELLKLNQTLRALDKSSQAMVRAKDEASYLDEVCKIIIKECHYTMVWVGYAQEDEDKTVKPMAYCGFEKGYLETLNLTWADTERGHGPTGTAIRTGKGEVCTNMMTDPKFTPWRKQAIMRGYASSMALPLIVKGNTFGALTIYSEEPDSFSEAEAALLSEIASDLAYGITAIRWRIAQLEAEEQLKKKAAELKELNATKDKFFGIIAHDLKNPFASLLGASEILSNDPNQFDYETIKTFATLMHNAANSGHSLLENLLEWSRSQTGTLTYNPKKQDIGEIINLNISTLAAMAANKKIKLYMDLSEKLETEVDENMLNTILRNLITNAIKFTKQEGEVTVKAEKNKTDLVITVKDTGVGIPKDDLQKLFRIDIKYSNIGTSEERGTGLGLLLCKEFVEKHGGKIWVESEVGIGSDFKFSIPFK